MPVHPGVRMSGYAKAVAKIKNSKKFQKIPKNSIFALKSLVLRGTLSESEPIPHSDPAPLAGSRRYVGGRIPSPAAWTATLPG
eukprot:COSAG04_NODE_1566_length_6320_cov_15.884102_12_plen_83_part_00